MKESSIWRTESKVYHSPHVFSFKVILLTAPGRKEVKEYCMLQESEHRVQEEGRKSFLKRLENKLEAIPSPRTPFFLRHPSPFHPFIIQQLLLNTYQEKSYP